MRLPRWENTAGVNDVLAWICLIFGGLRLLRAPMQHSGVPGFDWVVPIPILVAFVLLVRRHDRAQVALVIGLALVAVSESMHLVNSGMDWVRIVFAALLPIFAYYVWTDRRGGEGHEPGGFMDAVRSPERRAEAAAIMHAQAAERDRMTLPETDEEVWRAVEDMLDPEANPSAGWFLQQIDETQLQPAIRRALVEERFDRRASDEHFDAWPVSSLLERMKAERDDAPLILPKLEHEDRFVRGVAAQRLAEIATIEIAERLTRMLDSDDDWTEERLLTGAAHGADRGSIDDEALRLLIEAVTAECRRREYVDGHLATFLLRVDRPQAVDVLTEILSPSTRSFSSILGALNDANVALPHERLEAWHTELRSRVVEPRDQWLVHSDIGAVILAHVVAGHPDGPALVEVALDDDGRDVRAYAIEAHKQLLGLNGLSFYDALSSREKAGTLNWQQRAWWDITSLQGQVSNGGFVQYYYNLYGRRANETHRALVEIGALRAAELLADSIAQFGPAGPSKNGAELEEQLAGLSQEAMQRLDDLDSAFYEDEDHLDTRLHLYTLEHRAHFWDLAEPETA